MHAPIEKTRQEVRNARAEKRAHAVACGVDEQFVSIMVESFMPASARMICSLRSSHTVSPTGLNTWSE